MKRSKFIVFLSALLCIAMLFVSCGNEEPADDSALEDAPSTEDNGDEVVIESLADKISTIEKYLEYTGEKNNASLEFKEKFSDSINSETLVSVFGSDSDSLSDYVAVIKTTNVMTFEADGVTPNTLIDDYVVKNVASGAVIFQSSTNPYIYGNTPGTKFTFRTLANIILEVGTETVDYATDPNGIYSYTYKYFTLDSDVAISTITGSNAGVREYVDQSSGDRVVVIPNAEYKGFTNIYDVAYVIRDDEIIYEFVDGTERSLPYFFAKYGNLKYVFKYMNGEYFIQVLDKDFVCILEYQIPNNIIGMDSPTFDEFTSPDVYILGNGNILFTGIYEAEEGSEDYDYEVYEAKYCYYSAIIDVKDLAVSEPELGFKIKDLYSAESDFAVCDVKSDFNIATITEFDKETLTTKDSMVVLNNSLEIEKTLPEIVYNQLIEADDVVFVDESKFVFTTTVQSKKFTYLVDTVREEKNLIANDAVYMDGYFYTEDAVYDYNLKRLYDIERDEIIFATVGNSILITDGSVYKLFTIEKSGLSGTVTVADNEAKTEIVTVADDYVVVSERYGEMFDKTRYYVYNSDGNVIVTADYDPVIHSITDGIYCVEYKYNYTVIDSSGEVTKVYTKVIVLNCK